jgi:hypothetical protein
MKYVISAILSTTIIIIFIGACQRDKEINYYKAFSERSMAFKTEKVFKYIYSIDYDVFADSTFVSKRRILNDSSFIDYNLFGISDTDVFCSINFKTEKNIWYVFSGSKWQIFYANGKLHNVDLLYSKRQLTPKTKYVMNGKELHSFECDESDGSVLSHTSTYYFSPQYGIVVIASGHYYKREDYNLEGLDSLMNLNHFIPLH